MTDRIEPALTPDEWKQKRACDAHGNGAMISSGVLVGLSGGAIAAVLDPAKTIALANAALPDDDLRKIARADVENLRGILTADAWAVAKADIRRLADALASYLPPE
jgi:hypothetical protein